MSHGSLKPRPLLYFSTLHFNKFRVYVRLYESYSSLRLLERFKIQIKGSQVLCFLKQCGQLNQTFDFLINECG